MAAAASALRHGEKAGTNAGGGLEPRGGPPTRDGDLMMPKTVLVVDDDANIAELVAALLEDEGYGVRCAFDGREALEEIERNPPGLIVSDVMMPKLDGVSLTQQLRTRGHRTPVVLMSAVYADVDIPGVRFVPKPFDIDYIVAVVNRIFAEATVPTG